MVKSTLLLALVASSSLALAKKKPDVVPDPKWYDPDHADTVEDAAFNCIVNLAEAYPDKVCSHKFKSSNLKPYADVCSLGNLLMFDQQHYVYCGHIFTKHGKTIRPSKRPCLKKPPPTVTATTTVVKVVNNNYLAPITITADPSEETYRADTASRARQPARNGKADGVLPTTLKTVTRTAVEIHVSTTTATKTATEGVTRTTTTTATNSAKAPTTSHGHSSWQACQAARARSSGEVDIGQWCVGYYEEDGEEHTE